MASTNSVAEEEKTSTGSSRCSSGSSGSTAAAPPPAEASKVVAADVVVATDVPAQTKQVVLAPPEEGGGTGGIRSCPPSPAASAAPRRSCLRTGDDASKNPPAAAAAAANLESNNSNNENLNGGGSNHSAGRRKRVGFDRLTIAEYGVTLGDNPSTSEGPPVQLGWEVQQRYECTVHEYEAQSAGGRRSIEQLKMPAVVRSRLLKHQHSDAEIEEAAAQSRRASSQRAMTIAMQELEGFEEFWQSACRKFRRWRKSGKQKRQQKQQGSSAVDGGTGQELAELWLKNQKMEYNKLLKSASSSPSASASPVVTKAVVTTKTDSSSLSAVAADPLDQSGSTVSVNSAASVTSEKVDGTSGSVVKIENGQD